MWKNDSIQTYCRVLTPQQEGEIIESIKNLAITNVASKICGICQKPVSIPVLLSGNLECRDCGQQIYCLRCVRTYFQMNMSGPERTETKHVICQSVVNTRKLNANNSYRILIDIMNALDEKDAKSEVPPVFNCTGQCTQTFSSRKALHNHMRNGTCPESFYFCIFCSHAFKPTEFIVHMSRLNQLTNMVQCSNS
jgi:hypothetical protein